MGVASLRSLKTYNPLSEEDDTILESLRRRNLSLELSDVVEWMRTERLKGEQEGLSLETLELDGEFNADDPGDMPRNGLRRLTEL